MTIFKAFLKILNKNKAMLIFYTILLAGITYTNTMNSESSLSFASVKPDLYVINEDDSLLSKDLVSYLDENTNFVEIGNNEEDILDAVFYRNVNYVVTIPKGFGNILLKGNNPQIDVKSTGDYNASFAEMLLSRYIRLVNFYSNRVEDEKNLIEYVRSTIDRESDINITSNLDTGTLSKMSIYYDFTNYSIIAALVYVICIVLIVFKNEKIYKRTIISGMSYKKINRYLLLSNLLLAFILFIIYTLISFVIVGDLMFSTNGLICILNMFVFTICATSFAIFIGNLIREKNAVSGIINVVALGSSFLCGSFIPQTWLPNSVILISHIFPSYYYIKSNDIAVRIENFNLENIMPILINYLILILFTIVFCILSLYVSKKKRVIN